MSDKTALPTLAELQTLIEKLTPPNEEMDEVSASLILERAGVDLSTMADDLKMSLESAIAEMRASGEEVPPTLVEMMALLQEEAHLPGEDSKEDEEVEPAAWIDRLLAGEIPGSNRRAGQQVQAFRAMRKEFLTEDDLLLLEELAAEVRAQPDEEKG